MTCGWSVLPVRRGGGLVPEPSQLFDGARRSDRVFMPQTLSQTQPMLSSCAPFSRSRITLHESLSCHHSRLLFGWTSQSGNVWQEHPSVNTATRAPVNEMSSPHGRTRVIHPCADDRPSAVLARSIFQSSRGARRCCI